MVTGLLQGAVGSNPWLDYNKEVVRTGIQMQVSKMQAPNHSMLLLCDGVKADKSPVPYLHSQSGDTCACSRAVWWEMTDPEMEAFFAVPNWSSSLALPIPLDLSSLLYEMRGKAWPHSSRTMLCCYGLY